VPEIETKEVKEPKLCFECSKKLTPVGIDWNVLCEKCYKLFVK
jgi:hypothetical protein